MKAHLGGSSRQLGPRAVALAALALAAALLLWRCPVAELFAVPCPGCGLTRAALALVRGDLSRAMQLHPLSPALVPVGAWLAWRERVARSLPRVAAEPWRERLALAVAGLLLGVWLARFWGAFGGPAPVVSHLHG